MTIPQTEITSLYKLEDVLEVTKIILKKLQPTDTGWKVFFKGDKVCIEYSSNEYFITVRPINKVSFDSFSRRTEIFKTPDFMKLTVFILEHTSPDYDIAEIILQKGKKNVRS